MFGVHQSKEAKYASPHPRAMEHAVLDGLTPMVDTQPRNSLQVSNGPGNLEHPIVCPRRKGQAGHRLSEYPGRRIVQGTPTTNFSGSHVAVRPHLWNIVKTLMLPVASRGDACTNGLAPLLRGFGSQIVDRNGRHFNMEINAIQEGAGNARTIPGDGRGVARAPVSFRSVQSARAPVRITIEPVSSGDTWSLDTRARQHSAEDHRETIQQ